MNNLKKPTASAPSNGVSSPALLSGSSISDVAPTATRKRLPKMETRYRGRIYLCSGEKGGIGKTLIARSIIEVKRSAGIKVRPVEADVANLDIEKLFGLDGHINLQKEGGYIDLLNHLEEIGEDEDAVVSLPAGALAGAGVRGEGFLDGLPGLGEDLKKDVIVVWPIDDKQLSVEMLRSFIERCPGMRVDVVGNKFFFNEFSVYENSHTKEIIEANGGRFVSSPRLQPQVMQRMVDERLSFDAALDTLPIGARYELQRWIRSLKATFVEIGYIGEEK